MVPIAFIHLTSKQSPISVAENCRYTLTNMSKLHNINPVLIQRLKENTVANSGLHHLDIANSGAGVREISAIADALRFNALQAEGMAPLITIDISGNHVCGVDASLSGTFDSEGFTEFCNAVNATAKASRLRKINFSNNFLDTKGFSLVSNILEKGPDALCELYLQSCGGNPTAVEALMQGIKPDKALTLLDLRENFIGLEGAPYISDMLAVNRRMIHLNISECQIGAEGCGIISKGLSTNQCLQALSLGDNNIGDAGAEHIATMLAANQSLKHLDLQENRITNTGMIELGKSLEKNRTLLFLGLQWNEITNEGAHEFAIGLEMNIILKAVHLLGNHIDVDGIGAIIKAGTHVGRSDAHIEVDLGFAYNSLAHGHAHDQIH